MVARALRRTAWLGLAWLLLAALTAPASLAAGDQITLTETHTDFFPKVSIRLAANNAGGGPIGGLEASDFVVEENGQRVSDVEVYSTRVSKTPLSVVLTVDVSGSMADEAKMEKAKAAAKTFVSELRPIDQVEIVSFSNTVAVVTKFTNDRKQLIQGLDGLKPQGDTALYDATDQAVAEAIRVPGSKVVVVLTDGEDTISKVSLTQPLGIATQKHVPIYTIGLGEGVKDDILTRMASETAGRYYKAPKPDDLTYAFKLLSRQINNQYEMYYRSPLELVPGGRVDVVVRVLQANSPAIESRFSYRMPAFVRKVESTPVPIEAGTLREVAVTPRPTPTPPPPPPSAPSPFWAEAVAISAGLGALALFSGLVLGLTRDATEVRLATFVESAILTPGRRRVAEAGGRFLAPIVQSLAGLVLRFLPSRQIQETRQYLILAGHPYGWGVEEFMGMRGMFGCLLGVLVYLAARGSQPLMAPLLAVVMALLGFLLPVFWLRSKIAARQKEIFKSMPNALDLLSVSVEAGLGFDQAVAEVCQKWHNALTEEFGLMLGELSMGRSRRDALKGLMGRTGVPEIGGFASALIQADELGASITRTLNVQAEQIRMRRRQRAEQEAHEAAIKMLFPLVFLMFPSLFIVILGPALPTMMESFKHLGK